MPFVMAISMCYLSVYTPMRAEWMESQLRDVDSWWHGNITTDALVARVEAAEWVYVSALWVLAPVVEVA